jgi:O-antigen ligase
LLRAATYLAFASAATVLFPIAVSQILLALALIGLLISGAKLRLPPIVWPLGGFLAWTFVSLAVSPDPAGGLPQVRKMFVFSMLLVVTSLVRDPELIRKLSLVWFAGGTIVAGRGLVQFGIKWSDARSRGVDFYQSYVGDRMTGFMSHWMTFGGLEMIVLLLAVAYLFFAEKRKAAWWLAVMIMAAALALSFTRGVWIAAAAGVVYLVWHRRKEALLALPVLGAIGFFAAPDSLRDRMTSALQPRAGVDSNQHRVVTWRTGVEMIKAHPLTGLGPEQVGKEFNDFVPADIARPLPTGWYGHLHNIYLHYAAERGIPAALFLVWLLIQMLVDFGRAGGTSWFVRGAAASVIAVMVGGIFELNLGDSEVLMLFLAVISCAYVLIDDQRA